MTHQAISLHRKRYADVSQGNSLSAGIHIYDWRVISYSPPTSDSKLILSKAVQGVFEACEVSQVYLSVKNEFQVTLSHALAQCKKRVIFQSITKVILTQKEQDFIDKKVISCSWFRHYWNGIHFHLKLWYSDQFLILHSLIIPTRILGKNAVVILAVSL